MESEKEVKMDHDCDTELCMFTVKGLEKYAQREIEELLKPKSIRIIPGIIVTTFNVLSASLLKQMRSLRSVSKIICLVGELHDVPLKQGEIQQYLDKNVLKITDKIRTNWEIAYKCWKYSCCDDELFINNASIPNKTRRRFEKEINKKKDDTQTNSKSRNKLHDININLQHPVYRAKCLRKGQHEWNSLFIEKEIASPLHEVLGFEVNLKYYDIELFCFVRDDMMLYGVSVISDLNIRNRISLSWSTILDNTICFLVGQVANIKDNMVIWDPLCGVGSTVIEWKLSHAQYNNVKYIGSDINEKGIKQAMLNAKYCDIKVNDDMYAMDMNINDCDVMEFYTLDICEITQKEMSDECVDIIVSDLPFGHKCGSHKKNKKMYPLMLRTMNRILKLNGKAMLITMERKLLAKLLNEDKNEWKYDTVEIDVGGFDALLFLITKIAKYPCDDTQSKLNANEEKSEIDNKASDDNANDSEGNFDYKACRKMSLDSQ